MLHSWISAVRLIQLRLSATAPLLLSSSYKSVFPAVSLLLPVVGSPIQGSKICWFLHTETDSHVRWYCTRSSCGGAEVVAEESSACGYSLLVLLCVLYGEGPWFCSDFSCFLGFCCETGDYAWWNGQFDDLALHYSWQSWGMLFSCNFVDVFWIRTSIYGLIVVFDIMQFMPNCNILHALILVYLNGSFTNLIYPWIFFSLFIWLLHRFCTWSLLETYIFSLYARALFSLQATLDVWESLSFEVYILVIVIFSIII